MTGRHREILYQALAFIRFNDIHFFSIHIHFQKLVRLPSFPSSHFALSLLPRILSLFLPPLWTMTLESAALGLSLAFDTSSFVTLGKLTWFGMYFFFCKIRIIIPLSQDYDEYKLSL